MMSQSQEPVLLTAAEAARRVRTSQSQVYRWAQEPGCPVIRLGRRKGVRFIWPDLFAWLQQRSQSPALAPQAPVRTRAAQAAPQRTGRMSRMERAIREGRVRW